MQDGFERPDKPAPPLGLLVLQAGVSLLFIFLLMGLHPSPSRVPDGQDFMITLPLILFGCPISIATLYVMYRAKGALPPGKRLPAAYLVVVWTIILSPFVLILSGSFVGVY